MKKSLKFILLGIAALLIIAVLVIFTPWATGWAKGVGYAGELSGEYAVGFRRIMAEDPSRPETFTEAADDHRQIMVGVYYPASLDENATPLSYGNGSRKEIAKAAGFPYFFTAPLKLNRVANAEPAPGQFPVLVFSPGSDGPTAFYATLLEQLERDAVPPADDDVGRRTDPAHEAAGRRGRHGGHRLGQQLVELLVAL